MKTSQRQRPSRIFYGYCPSVWWPKYKYDQSWFGWSQQSRRRMKKSVCQLATAASDRDPCHRLLYKICLWSWCLRMNGHAFTLSAATLNKLQTITNRIMKTVWDTLQRDLLIDYWMKAHTWGYPILMKAAGLCGRVGLGLYGYEDELSSSRIIVWLSWVPFLKIAM